MNTMTDSPSFAAPPAAVAMPRGRIVNAYLQEVRSECLRYLRAPGFLLPTLLFPTVFYLMFGVLLGHANGPDAPRFLLAAYGTFGVMAPGLFGFGVSLALERDNCLLTLKRALPMPPGAYLLGKMVMAMMVVAVVASLMIGMALFLAHVPLSAGQMSALFVTDLLGVLPFCALGLLVGTLIKGQGAPGLVNLVYLPMSFLSGLWFPLAMMPKFLQQIALLWPSYHLNQLALAAVGLGQGGITSHVLVLAGYTGVFLLLASRRLRRYGCTGANVRLALPWMPSMKQQLSQWFAIAPDSVAATNVRKGKSAWVDLVHLLWSVWIFITPVFDQKSWNASWLAFTVTSYPFFLVLYLKSLVCPRDHARAFALTMILLSMALLPWYPSGLVYFVYGCVTFRVCRASFYQYLASLLVLDTLVLLECWLIGYPWQAVVSVPVTTLIICVIVNAERTSEEKTAELALSHEEVRRLAATAERERIGRDLHDLLGHTLSMITLKLELSRKLFDRDPDAAKREITEAERVARHALAEVRCAVTGIRATDLAAELASARLMLESVGVHLEHAALPALPQEIERMLALVLREAVTNIARHACASRARVALKVSSSSVRMYVIDNGRGGIADAGNGLGGMRERIRQLGGSLDIESPLRQGTNLIVNVPLRASIAATDGSGTTAREAAA